MERALKRAETEGRADDTREVIERRLEIYHSETEPIVEHYRVTGKLVPLHGERSIEEVWSQVASALEQVVAA
jgi:adenylate kinase